MSATPTAKYEDAARCPFDFLAKSRRETPVVKLESPEPDRNGFMVTRYADIAAVCKDTQTYSSIGNPQSDGWAGYCEAARAIYRERGWPLERVLVWVDPPEHKRFRKHVDKIFSPSRVAARADHISLCIDKIMARMPEGDSFTIDGIVDYARMLPAMVMTREFAADEDDYEYLMTTTDIFGRTIEFTQDYGAGPEQIAIEAAEAATAFQNYMLPRIEAVRANPNNTMLSELVHARDGDEPALTLEEIQSILIVFLIAATHSTMAMLAWVLKCLADQTEVQARLRREPDKIEAFVEEALRMHGTVATSFRTTTRDAELAGVEIPQGAQVYVRWDSANQDEEKWEEPTRFSLERRGVRTHMAFGSGPHTCVGNTLARRELVMTVTAFLDRFSCISIAAEPERLASFGLQALTTLPLHLIRQKDN